MKKHKRMIGRICLLLALLFLLPAAFVQPVAAEDDEAAGEPVEFRIMSSLWGDHEKSLNEDGSNEILDEFMRLTNTKITYEWFPSDQYVNRVTTTLAEGDFPEVINGAMTNLVNEGAARPLDELLEEYGPNIKALYADQPVEAAKLRSVDDGQTYAIPFALIYPPAFAWNIRTDWLENVGIEKMPETWDEWLEVWEAFKTQDPNQDGNTDNDIPLSADVYSLMPLFGMNVANRFGLMIDDEGNYTVAPESEQFRPFLEAVRDLYEKGYLDPEFADRGVWVNNNSLNDAINAGLVGSSFTWAEVTRTATLGLGEVVEGARLEGIVPPMGPNGDRGIPARGMLGATSCITVSADDELAAEIMKYFNTVFSEEGVRLASYGIEGTHYDLVDNEPVLKPEYANSFADARSAGLNFTPLAHHFDAQAYEKILLAGKTYEESEEPTQIFYDALHMGEGYYFNPAVTMNTEAHAEYATDIFSQLGSHLASCVVGDISIDEFYDRYNDLKAAGLDEILEAGNEAWQAMQ